ncbi:MAG: DUF4258 domain-containing protein [Chloroflexi bacterium]|nr:DUF4258 domain-containing protein [Chloroflexota bacterium]
MQMPILSRHARVRCAQRGLRKRDVWYVLKHGTRIYRNGAVHYFLRRRDIPPADRKRYERLNGTGVVVSLDHSRIITVYRNRAKMPKAA